MKGPGSRATRSTSGWRASSPACRRSPVRRHHRRRLERAGGSRERGAVRPEAPRRPRRSSSRATSTTSPRARSGARCPACRRSRRPLDLDGDGDVEFGEVLPDAGVPASPRRASSTATPGAADARRAPWQPTPADAFTALVVMVPTMSEYFGQWKESRFVLGDAADRENFNVVSRLSDIHDILASLAGRLRRRASRSSPARARAQAQQTGERARRASSASSSDLSAQEQAGKRFTPEQAELLGAEAQERGDRDRRPGHPGGSRARHHDRGVGAPRARRTCVAARSLAVLRAGAAGAGRRRAGPPGRRPPTCARRSATPRRARCSTAGDAAGARRGAARSAARAGSRAAPAAPPTRAALDARARRGGGRACAPDDGPALAVARADAWTALLRVAAARRSPPPRPATPTTARRWLLRARVPAADALLRAPAPTPRSRSPRSSRHARAARGRAAPSAPTCSTRTRRLLRSGARRRRRRPATPAIRRAPPGRGARARLLRDARAVVRDAARRAARRRDGRRLRRARGRGRRERGGGRTRRRVDARCSRASAPRRSRRAEVVRRAGQVQRFLALVPVEYGRGVSDGRVTLGVRDPGGDHVPRRRRAAPSPTWSRAARRATRRRRAQLGRARRGSAPTSRPPPAAARVADPDDAEAHAPTRARRSRRASSRTAWHDAAGTRRLRRHPRDARPPRGRGRGRVGTATAEQARLEAYAFFEFGPEQRLRGLAPGLFTKRRGATSGTARAATPGLAQLVARHARAGGDRRDARRARRGAARDAEAAIGAGPEPTHRGRHEHGHDRLPRGPRGRAHPRRADRRACVGAQRRLRRPLYVGAARALAASALTWVVAQTHARLAHPLRREARGGGRRSLRSRVLLLILNWFFHKVYWTEPPRRPARQKKRRVLGARARLPGRAGCVGLAAARLHERLPRGLRDRALPAGDRARGRRCRTCCSASRSASSATGGRRRPDVRAAAQLPYKRMLVHDRGAGGLGAGGDGRARRCRCCRRSAGCR